MAIADLTPMQELKTVLAHYDHELDEPSTIPFMAKVREKCIIDDGEWRNVLQWLDEAMAHLKDESSRDDGRALSVDADPRNADWLRIVRAQRLAGYRMPHWASLWLWWIGYDREETAYWKQIGEIAKAMGFPSLEEG